MQVAQKRYHNINKRKWWQKIFRKKQNYSQLLDRSIYSNYPDPEIPNNYIQTSKYNVFTFLPLNIAEQFSKPSNIYFLIIGILQTIPVISLSEGKPTIFLPLIIVVTISMIKDFFQDLKRHKSDKKQNQSKTHLLTGVGFASRQWQQLQVGNIIKVYKDQYFPCDVILLDHDKSQQTAFIQTKNLDGQTNLKLKKTCQQLNFLRDLSELDLSTLQIQFSFQKPNPFLSTFNGNVRIRDKKYMVQNSNVVLRGCSLKINEWAVGMCVYTGHETKILLNSGQKSIKTSSLQNYLNNYFKWIFLFQISVTLISAIAFGILTGINQNNLGYISQTSSIIAGIFYTWGSWFISFSNFIPISLLVTVELVRYGQGMTLNKDQLCSSKGQFTEVQTSRINQQLGQVRYILSDKTGTLTQNLMQFKCLYVNGYSYGEDIANNIPIIQEQHNSTDRKINTFQKQYQLVKKQNKIQNVDFPQHHKNKIIKQLINKSIQSRKLHDCLLHLSLCHNVIPEGKSYTSSSPDELALVSFSKYIGYQYAGKDDQNYMQVKTLINNHLEVFRYKLLHVLQFSSQRKRMSVIIQDNQGRILLLCKGADEVILNRVQKRLQVIEETNKQLAQIHEALFHYACQGLRTLLLAQKQIKLQQYEVWNKKYEQALTIIGQQRYQIIDNLQSQIERDLLIVGATAIQDKLQQNVKETIQQLKKSNLKVWMLTGDKKQTAISIGFSCGLIDKKSERITLDCGPQNAKQLLTNLVSMMHLINNKKVTIISGDFIKKIDQQTKKLLQNILMQSQSVICCRVSPKDKQQITKMVKNWGVTLAIGDGANDVNMINSANIGVGVRGIQGSQATRAADYVITQFKLLHRLITYHGLNFYHRNSNVMLYTLYKNMLVTLPNLLYGPLSMQSGTYIYDIWSIQLYNIFYVALPIVYYGLFDIIYSQRKLKQLPWLYEQGQNCKYFNRKILLRQLIQTVLICVIMLYVIFYSTEQALCGRNLMIYIEWSGNIILAIVVVSCNIRVIVMSNQFNIIQGLFCALGIVLYYLFYFLIGLIIQGDSKNVFNHQVGTAIYWYLVFFFTFLIQGYQIVKLTINNIDNAIESNIRKDKLKDQNLHDIQIQMGSVKYGDVKQLSVNNDNIQQINQIGGYAFAQDDNRYNVNLEISEKRKRRGSMI